MPQPLLPEYLDSKQEAPEVKIAGLSELEDRIDSVERDMKRLQLQMSALSQESLRTIARLLSPLYKSLKPIFGELEAVGVEYIGMEAAVPASTGKQSQWESVKQRLKPREREVIDVLLLQGQMGRTQIAAAIKMDYTHCRKTVIAPLISQGWLVESGGKIALKNL